MMDRYKGAALGELDPHVFAIADSAFRLFSCLFPIVRIRGGNIKLKRVNMGCEILVTGQMGIT